MKQSVNLQLFNYFYTRFEELAVLIIRKDDKGKNDELYIQVQSILLDEIQLDGYTLTLPQISVNESTEQETNQTLSHTTISVEYASH